MKNILKINFLIILFVLCFSAKVFAKTDIIEGYVKEALTLNDDNTVKTSANLAGISVDLYNAETNEYISSALTDSDGKYSFTVNDLNKYQVKLTYPYSTEDINNADVTKSKKIQNNLKYNTQDYIIASNRTATNFTIEEKGKAHVYMVLDISASMRVSDGNSSTSRLDSMKKTSKNIINSLLTDEAEDNIDISIIQFSSENDTKMLKDLTSDRSDLISSIENLKASGSTYTGDGLKIARENIERNKNSSDEKVTNFVFLLTDGVVTSYNKNVFQKEVSNLRDTLQVKLCAIMIGGDNDFLKQNLKDDYHASGSLNDEKLQEVITDFISSVHQSVEIVDDEYALEFNDSEYIKNHNREFNYKSTFYFKAIDVNITNENLSTFKEYAKQLIHEEAFSLISKPIKTKSSYRNLKNDDTVFANKGPDFYFKARDPFTLVPSIELNSIKVLTANGQLLDDTKITDKSNPYYKTINENYLYGSKVYLNYSASIKNVSSNNNTEYISCLCYLPDYISIDENNISVLGHSDKVRNANLKHASMILTEKNVRKYSKYLSESVIKHIESKHPAMVIYINLKNSNFTLSKDAYITIDYSAERTLSYDDEMSYEGFIEILQYKNDSYRRLQYNKTGAVAGNDISTALTFENDSAKSNKVALLVPTGSNKDMTKLYIALGLAIISIFILISIKKK